ncbi:hypothetical protein ECANGB1_397 [Enterospora canceri]|uniref:Uncharacterized protein n=1 Tax=Enterospora canceri TaxID=1081671 RepID=A0A1Y1S821_9MICR|nr:hypothetical protein ECANGB1_397 [Enterospora canceri]
MEIVDFKLEDLEEVEEQVPADLCESYLIGDRHGLSLLERDPEIIQAIAAKKCFFVPNKRKKTGVWNENETKKQVFYNWIVKRKDENGEDVLEGPFVNREMKNLLVKNMLTGTSIRRVCDVEFVPFEKLYEAHPNFIYTETDLLNRLFNIRMPKEDNRIKVEESTRVNRIIEKYSIQATQEEIINMIRGTIKNEALMTMKKNLKMQQNECIVVLDTILEETKTQILLDVDKDGFKINMEKNKKQGSSYHSRKKTMN